MTVSRTLIVAVVSVAIAACSDSRTKGITEPAAATDAVTHNLSRQLSAAGEFPPQTPRSRGRPMITAAQAKSLALNYMRLFGPFHLQRLIAEHGASFIIADLTVDDRITIAESPYEPVGKSVLNPTHKNLGAFYLVTLRDRHGARVLIAVSVYATDIEFANGGLHYRGTEGIRGNEFRSSGISAKSGAYVISPEEAAITAAKATGALVERVPTFVRRGAEFTPASGSWMITLDRPVSIKQQSGPARPVATRTVFVNGRSASLEIAAPNTPVEYARTPSINGTKISPAKLTISRSSGFPAALLPAFLAEEN